MTTTQQPGGGSSAADNMRGALLALLTSLHLNSADVQSDFILLHLAINPPPHVTQQAPTHTRTCSYSTLVPGQLQLSLDNEVRTLME